jgi:hypothetical protein
MIFQREVVVLVGAYFNGWLLAAGVAGRGFVCLHIPAYRCFA